MKQFFKGRIEYERRDEVNGRLIEFVIGRNTITWNMVFTVAWWCANNNVNAGTNIRVAPITFSTSTNPDRCAVYGLSFTSGVVDSVNLVGLPTYFPEYIATYSYIDITSSWFPFNAQAPTVVPTGAPQSGNHGVFGTNFAYFRLSGAKFVNNSTSAVNIRRLVLCATDSRGSIVTTDTGYCIPFLQAHREINITLNQNESLTVDWEIRFQK